MSKELDYLDKILNYQPLTLVERTIIECIKKKIHRLESIDNAEPSEALECLERLHDCGIFNYEEMEDYNTVKNYILKTQEQENKKYLKWEDLEFKETEQTMEVLLNGEEYKLSYFTDGITEYVDLITNDEKFLIGKYVCDYEKQFFNDLHLERVE